MRVCLQMCLQRRDEKMFTDDPYLLTGVLLVAMIPLYILIIKKLRPTQPRARTTNVNHIKNAYDNNPYNNANNHANNNTNNHNLRLKKKKNIALEKKPTRSVQVENPEHVCYHDFGYLRTIPKNASIPNDCLGCPKIVECLTHE